MSTSLRATALVDYTSGAGSYDLVIPAGVQNGDVGVFSLQINSSVATIGSPPSGWTTQLGPDPTSTAAEVILFTKALSAADAGTTATFALDGGVTARALGILDVIAGGTLSGAIFGSSIPVHAQSTNTVPTLASVPLGAYVSVHEHTRVTGAGIACVVPSGYTDDGDLFTSAQGSGQNFSALTAHKIASAAGSYGGETVTYSASCVCPIYAAAIPAAPGGSAFSGSGSLSGSGTLSTSASVRSGKPKVWNGTAWVGHPSKVWNGTAWVAHPTKAQTASGLVIAK